MTRPVTVRFVSRRVLPPHNPSSFRMLMFQELAIWQEQRDEAKQRKAPGASRSSSGAVREGKVAMGLTDEATGRDENDAKPAAEVG